MTQQPTCGPLFRKAFDTLQEIDDSPLHMFSGGHLVGQAEKVWLGACSAFMCRPTEDEFAAFIIRVKIVSGIYGLIWSILDTTKGREIWVYKENTTPLINILRLHNGDNPTGHFIRGILCGVPTCDIDVAFHTRYKDMH